MKIKDQIRIRREALGMSMKELADRVGVTEQAVRHWEGGRSFPGKKKTSLVEQALSFTIDWSEGSPVAEGRTAAAMVDQQDMELLLVIARLPRRAKEVIGEMARMHADAVDRARGVLPPEPPAPPPPVAAAGKRVSKAPSPAAAVAKR